MPKRIAPVGNATLEEVARTAGVSVITASRALRGVGYVAEATRQKVVEAATRLDYAPDMLAQRMRGGSSQLIGVFVNGFASMVMHELLSSIDIEARRLGFDLMVFNSRTFDDPGRASTSDMVRKLCDGLLIVFPNNEDGLLAKLERIHARCVLINFAARPIDLPVVIGANRPAARRATEYLLSLGHRRIAFIAGSSYTGQSQERQQGYEEAMRAAGIEVRPEWIGHGNFDQPTGQAAAEALLALPERPTAIFAGNDEMAFGAMDAIAAAGLRIPEDISVVGFDDIHTANFVHPRLTTLHHPSKEIAERAVAELVGMIQHGTLGASRIELPTRLVVRESTGPAPAGA